MSPLLWRWLAGGFDDERTRDTGDMDAADLGRQRLGAHRLHTGLVEYQRQWAGTELRVWWWTSGGLTPALTVGSATAFGEGDWGGDTHGGSPGRV